MGSTGIKGRVGAQVPGFPQVDGPICAVSTRLWLPDAIGRDFSAGLPGRVPA
jgi:hypothetical protein